MRKKLALSITLQKLPSQPASTLPATIVVSPSPIVIESMQQEAAERHLDDRRGLATALRLARPQRHQQRREGEDHERIEGLEPGHRDLRMRDQEIDVAILDDGPMYQAVALGLCGDLKGVNYGDAR